MSKVDAARISKLDVYRCSMMSPGNPYILGVKRSKVKVTKTVPAWVIALRSAFRARYRDRVFPVSLSLSALPKL